MRTQSIEQSPAARQKEHARQESIKTREQQRSVMSKRVSQRLARLSLPLRRGQGRDPS